MKGPDKTFLAVFLGPALALFTVFVAWPAVRALIYSLQKWDGFREAEWVGFDNFRTLFGDSLFRQALAHNGILMAAGGGITIALALFFASLLHRKIRGAGLFRVAFFFPNVISAVAIALLWLLLYSTSDFGLINGVLVGIRSVLGAVGIDVWEETLPFAFTDSQHLIYSLIPMMVWTATGFYMVLFLAAMQSIPEEYYEAAHLDGASPLSQFWHVTLPMIREVVVVGVVFIVISSAKFFDAVWVIENQYPTNDSHVLATVLYQKAFSEYNIGYAAAVAVVLFVIVFLLTLVTFRFSRKDALEY